MRRSQFTNQQIAFALQQAEYGPLSGSAIHLLTLTTLGLIILQSFLGTQYLEASLPGLAQAGQHHQTSLDIWEKRSKKRVPN